MPPRPSKSGLPVYMRCRPRGNKVFYYFDTGGKPRKEIPLGTDFAAAMVRYCDLMVAPEKKTAITFEQVALRYRTEVIPTKAEGTQKQNHYELKNLLAFFCDPSPAPLDSITPEHINQYLEWRSCAKVKANREISLFSHIFNRARKWGYTRQPNPCTGVEKNKEYGRDVYIEDDVYAKLLEIEDLPLREVIEFAYLTGQRPSDVLQITDADVRDNALHFQQAKTNTKVRIEISGELKNLLIRIAERKASIQQVASAFLIVNEKGQRIGYKAMNERFVTARKQLGFNTKNLQFRDLRAKAATDKAEEAGSYEAQRLLGHSSVTMTEKYIRNRRGNRVKPTK